MARPIDGDRLVMKLNNMFEKGLISSLVDVEDAINDMPTLPQPSNEPLTLEWVAKVLAEQCRDECACNLNGNDEWLPMVCQYQAACPDPHEHLGCWMELLRRKYRRPPEGKV